MRRCPSVTVGVAGGRFAGWRKPLWLHAPEAYRPGRHDVQTQAWSAAYRRTWPRVVDAFWGSQGQARLLFGSEEGHCPADVALGLEGSATAALARLVCRAAAQQVFGAASRDLAE